MSSNEFADAHKILHMKDEVGTLIVFTTMTKKPTRVGEEEHWFQTLVVEKTIVGDMKPVFGSTHTNALSAVNFHQNVLRLMRTTIDMVSIPMKILLEAREAELRDAKKDIRRLESDLNTRKGAKKRPAKASDAK